MAFFDNLSEIISEKGKEAAEAYRQLEMQKQQWQN